MQAPPTDAMLSISPPATNRQALQKLCGDLAARIRGPVFLPEDPQYVLTFPVSHLHVNPPIPRFAERSKTFNGKLKPNQQLVVSPLDAQDVSAAILFCTEHGLSPSVRAGGYGIAGWAVAGDVVIDLSQMREVAIEPPVTAEDGSQTWTRLRDTVVPGRPGEKLRAAVEENPEIAAVTDVARPTAERTTSTKRRREASPVEERRADEGLVEDAHLRNYDAASHAVASFLRGPPLPPEDGEETRQPPANRRRLDTHIVPDGDIPSIEMPPLSERQASNESSGSSGGRSSGSGADSSSDGMRRSTSTAATSPTETPVDSDSAPAPLATPTGTDTPRAYATSDFIPAPPPSTRTADPFGYMSLPAPSAPPPAVFTGFRSFPSSLGPVNMFGQPVGAPANMSMNLPMNMSMSMPMNIPPNVFSSVPGSSASASALVPPQLGAPGFSHLGGLARARPVHGHAYVTIGAGMRQKEVDMYTAANPLPGVSGVSGAVEGGLVPYHVPT